MQPRGGGSILHVGRGNVVFAAGLGGQQPDHTSLIKGGLDVHELVHDEPEQAPLTGEGAR